MQQRVESPVKVMVQNEATMKAFHFLFSYMKAPKSLDSDNKLLAPFGIDERTMIIMTLRCIKTLSTTDSQTHAL